MDDPVTEGLRRPVGIWRAIAALGEYKLKHALWPEAVLALVLGGGGSVLVVRNTDLAQRTSTMGDVLFVAIALFAVVFAALAVVVSLPSTSYLRMLSDTPEGGMRKFLDPFLVAVGTQIVLVLLAIGYRFVAANLAAWLEHAAFYVTGFLLVFGLLDVAGLARQLVRHGILRAADAALSEVDAEEQAKVRRFPERRDAGG